MSSRTNQGPFEYLDEEARQFKESSENDGWEPVADVRTAIAEARTYARATL